MKPQLIISSYDDIHNPYYAGGGARAIHRTAQELSRSFHVTVLSGAYPGARDGVSEGVPYRHIGVAAFGPKVGQLIYQLVLPYYVRKESFHLWLESFTPPFSTGLLQLFTRKPVVGLVHMLAGEDMQRKYKLPFPALETLGLKTYRFFITTTEHMKATIQAANPEATVAVIPNGVEPIRTGKKSKKRHILYLGRIEIDQKGLDLLLTAYAEIANRTGYPLVIAGGGEKKQIRLLKQLLTERKLTEHVRYIGKVEGKTKERLLREAACVIIPSRFETFSLVALEAIAAGVPVVSFKIPGLSWVPQEAGLQVRPFDTKALAAAIRKTTTVTQHLPSVRLRRFTRQYTWETIGKQYEQYFATLTERDVWKH